VRGVTVLEPPKPLLLVLKRTVVDAEFSAVGQQSESSPSPESWLPSASSASSSLFSLAEAALGGGLRRILPPSLRRLRRTNPAPRSKKFLLAAFFGELSSS